MGTYEKLMSPEDGWVILELTDQSVAIDNADSVVDDNFNNDVDTDNVIAGDNIDVVAISMSTKKR